MELSVPLLGNTQLSVVRRQQNDRNDPDPGWMRRASLDFARGHTGRALGAYQRRDFLNWHPDRPKSIEALSGAFVADYGPIENGDGKTGHGSALILAHTRADVRALNEAVRERLRGSGRLGDEMIVATAGGERRLAVGEPLMFLQNDRQLGVNNGMLGRVVGMNCEEPVEPAGKNRSPALPRIRSLQVEVADGDGTRCVRLDPAVYDLFDHGYAATIHKSQGVTVDRAYVLATPGMDRHLTYVAMTRHRQSVLMAAGREDFAGGRRQDPQARLLWRLSRARRAENALDFAARRDPGEGREWLRDHLGRLAENGRWLNRQLRETVRGFMKDRLAGVRNGVPSPAPASARLWQVWREARKALQDVLDHGPRDATGLREIEVRRQAMRKAATDLLEDPRAREEANRRGELDALRQVGLMDGRGREQSMGMR